MGLYRRGKIWYYRLYTDGREIRRSSRTSNKNLAQMLLNKKKLDIAQGRLGIEPKRAKITFREMADLYLEVHSRPHKRKGTYMADVYAFRRLKDFFGNKYLDIITPLTIEHYKSVRKKEVSGTAINRDLERLRHLYNKAIAWGKATDNPVRKVKFFQEKGKRLRFLSREEIGRLIESLPEYLKPIVKFDLNIGLRKTDLLNLKWDDIDFQHNLCYISNPKGGKPLELPLNLVAKEILQSIKRRSDSPYIFPNPEGKPYRDIRVGYNKALKKAGIEGATFHTLRHTFASHLIMLGVPMKTVATLLGHTTIKMVDEIYGHLSKEHTQEAVNKLGKYLFSGSKPTQKPAHLEKTDTEG